MGDYSRYQLFYFQNCTNVHRQPSTTLFYTELRHIQDRKCKLSTLASATLCIQELWVRAVYVMLVRHRFTVYADCTAKFLILPDSRYEQSAICLRHNSLSLCTWVKWLNLFFFGRYWTPFGDAVMFLVFQRRLHIFLQTYSSIFIVIAYMECHAY